MCPIMEYYKYIKKKYIIIIKIIIIINNNNNKKKKNELFTGDIYMSKTQNKKSKFRSTNTWKSFRKSMKIKRKNDVITGRPLLKGWNLHHCDLNEEHYEDISNDYNFECLNKTTHEVIHWLFRYKNWREILKNIETLLEKMEKLNRHIK